MVDGSLMPWLGGSSTSNKPHNIINPWVPEGATQYSGTITTDGSYRLEIDYTKQGGPGEDAALVKYFCRLLLSFTTSKWSYAFC
ncbi:MAG: hypothetical protein BJBARM4_0936 [Candidatus Parvarchaeum acidiphilum ARMAN-4]|uniref:Uncharacterized protein n=1 Tax=Candidatus Parvarchaeum acidiphilum ARMAN-4 TaxID=662760 RepID=D2EGN7_PARA4|nr:MAG: hypothetical protein BJBARM4_0936 [Candidatus Parvarchaeum acidiphilum ARMAN-4]